MVAELIVGRSVHPISPLNIPGCTYCRPQVASVGMTEEKAKAAGYKLRVGRFPFIGNGKAIAMGEPEAWSRPSSMTPRVNCWVRIWLAPK